MFKVLMMAIVLGLAKAGLWLWRKKWWIITIFVLLFLGRHHSFASVIPWVKGLHMTADVVTVALFSAAAGIILGSFVTGMIMYGKREENKEKYKDWC